MAFPLGVAVVIAIMAAVGSRLPPSGWDHKAVASEHAASVIVGGFGSDDRALYHRGLQHLYNSHARIGALTIGDVIDQERDRENQREARRQAIADQKRELAAAAVARRRDLAAKAAAQAVVTGEKKDIVAALTLESQDPTFGAMIKRYQVDDSTLTITVDEDIWDSLGGQDQTLFNQGLFAAWSYSYNYWHHTKGEPVIVNENNLANDHISTYW
ncbi:MAG: hypothetical protein ACYCX6_00385 [Vulcanimicrobiaceae bacterium]